MKSNKRAIQQMGERWIVNFRDSKRTIDHYTMQILSGHGIFNVYRKTIRKETYSRCWDCNEEGDDAEYVLLKCPRWINPNGT